MTDAMPVGERPQLAPPVDESGLVGWARKHLFSSWGNGITTIVLTAASGSTPSPARDHERPRSSLRNRPCAPAR